MSKPLSYDQAAFVTLLNNAGFTSGEDITRAAILKVADNNGLGKPWWLIRARNNPHRTGERGTFLVPSASGATDAPVVAKGSNLMATVKPKQHVGDMRTALSNREIQPGNDRSFMKSEKLFEQLVRDVFYESHFEIRTQGDTSLKRMLGFNPDTNRPQGIHPEVEILNTKNNDRVFFEVKKQRKGGNAEERACKHHTPIFRHNVRKACGTSLEIPFITIMCEALATRGRYVSKHPFFLEPEAYFLWIDYSSDDMRTFLEEDVKKRISK